jgi:hypothetical protein
MVKMVDGKPEAYTDLAGGKTVMVGLQMEGERLSQSEPKVL